MTRRKETVRKPGTRTSTKLLASAAIPFMTPLLAHAAGEEGSGEGTYVAIWVLALVASIVALVQAYFFFKKMMTADEGTPRMVEIAGYVREGADAYLKQQYKVVAGFFVVIVLLLTWAAYANVQSSFVPFAFLTGGFFSGLAGWFGMKTATWASSRTAAGAQKSLNAGLQVAFRSGAVMGLTVVGLGLLDITLWFGFLYWVWPMIGQEQLSLVEITVTMLCFGMGASAQALFARVGGGIFTKAADVGADLVGKVEQGIPEDDPRNPATIADNVGDNVGDVAGMGADLYESYCGSILATAALGVAAYATTDLLPEGTTSNQMQMQALLLPIAIAAVGIFLSIIGIYFVRTGEDATQKNLLAALARGINLSTVLVIVASFGLAYLLMPRTPGTLVGGTIPGVAFSIFVGLAAGWLIGKWTEYSTSDEFAPTKRLAAQSETDAERFRSLGAVPERTWVTGNIKFDIEIAEGLPQQGTTLRRDNFDDRPVWVAASTHDREERMVLHAHRLVQKRYPNAMLVLVPRHPERFATVRTYLHKEGFRAVSRTDGLPCTPDTEVLLVDTMGELPLFYAAADVAFVGGTLVPIGGHNLLEAAALGRPVITGPYLFNTQDIANMFERLGASVTVNNAGQLGIAVADLFGDPQMSKDIGSRGLEIVRQNRGSLDRLLTLLEPLVRNAD